MVRLTPRATRDAIEAVSLRDDGRAVLLVRVRALPDKGAANAALTKLLAKELGIAVSDVSLESGQTARLKTLLLRGDAPQLAAALARVAGPNPS